MKLVLITAVHSFKREIQHLLKQSRVKTYSYRDVTGFKDLSEEALASNWFGSEINENESIAFYAFVPVENLGNKEIGIGMDYYLNLAHDSNPQMKSVKTNIAVADKNIEIIKTDKMPTLAGFGGYTLQRPITTRNPVLDMYASGWQGGVSLSYNIDNL